jgi:hypothetical protein
LQALYPLDPFYFLEQSRVVHFLCDLLQKLVARQHEYGIRIIK